MSDHPRILTFRGVRGSAPTPGPHTVRYGGHTTCLDLALNARHRLVLDCGSGLRRLESDLPGDPGPHGFHFDVFLTHYHFDHLEGLRFFRPLFDPRNRFVFHGFPWRQMGVREALEGSMSPPWFPVRLQDTGSSKEYVDLTGEPTCIEDVRIAAASVSHPQGAVAYRLERGSRSIGFITDSEPGKPTAEAAVQRLAQGVDVLIHDAQYTQDEYDGQYRSWGHSSWRHALAVAREANVGQVILFHHDPDRTDDDLDRIVAEARREFPGVEAAREGMTLEL